MTDMDHRDERECVTLEDAIGMLREQKNIPGYVHTFRQAGPFIVGADWNRDSLIETMRRAPAIEITGEFAQKMGHGLAIEDERGLLFIETHEPGTK